MKKTAHHSAIQLDLSGFLIAELHWINQQQFSIQLNSPRTAPIDPNGLPDEHNHIEHQLKTALQRITGLDFSLHTDWLTHPAFPSTPTAFQQRIWQATQAIPAGQTVSYADLTASAGKPGAARAVGNALNRNPWPILIPCHRVVAANHNGGYAWGGEIKQFLLKTEQRSLKTEQGKTS
ncbi:MAG TPA: MGMT family protein [Halothiobacillaceae bacterium]|nr:MGMT family protein [Halothiobacillaceae bacterium]